MVYLPILPSNKWIVGKITAEFKSEAIQRTVNSLPISDLFFFSLSLSLSVSVSLFMSYIKSTDCMKEIINK